MAIRGITEVGFIRPNLSDIIEESALELRETYGSDFNTGDNSIAGILLRVFANREFRVWQQLESVYNSQTPNGAEGEFLDELHGYRGIPRNAATASSGRTLVETDDRTSNTEEIVASSYFLAENSLRYNVDSPSLVSSNVRAYKIDASSLAAGSYNFRLTNANGIVESRIVALQGNTDAQRLTFFDGLKSFFDEVFPDDIDRILIDRRAGSTAFYAGHRFDTVALTYELIGMRSLFRLEHLNNNIGNRYTEISATATETGRNPLGVNGILTMSPTPEGFLSAVNIESFAAGTNIETDAEYNSRAVRQSDSPNNGSRAAVVSSVLDVDGVQDVSINKSISEVTGGVIIEPVVLGGGIDDIIAALYEAQPIDAVFTGTVTRTVNTQDGGVEVVGYSPAVERGIDVRITYTPISGASLSMVEQTAISSAIQNLNANLRIGSTLFNGRLSGVVFDTNPQRFSTLIVEVKDQNTPDSEYTVQNIIPEAAQLLRVSSARVAFVRVV